MCSETDVENRGGDKLPQMQFSYTRTGNHSRCNTKPRESFWLFSVPGIDQNDLSIGHLLQEGTGEK